MGIRGRKHYVHAKGFGGKAPGFADLKQSREKGQSDLSAFQVRIYIDPQDGIIPGMTIGVKDSEFTKR